MVSAVFHSPRAVADTPAAERSSSPAKPALTLASPPSSPAPAQAPKREPFDFAGLLGKVVPPVLGLPLLPVLDYLRVRGVLTS